MSKKIRGAFPYLIAPALWHLSGPHLNPFGILAIIPVFHYTFCDRTKHWPAYGLLMCFLIDYSAGTLFLFSALFLFANAVNNIYGVLDNEDGSAFDIKKFHTFLCAMAAFLFVYALFNASRFFGFLLGIIWLYLWLLVLYAPFVAAFRWVKNDR